MATLEEIIAGPVEEKKEEKKKEQPDYIGDGVAVWLKEDKNGKVYLSISLLKSINVLAFKNENKMQK